MWNYRLVRRTHQDGSRTYAIHEAYYDDRGRVQAVTKDPVEVFGESVREARRDHAMMAEAFAAPVLPMEKVTKKGAEPLATMRRPRRTPARRSPARDTSTRRSPGKG